MPVFHRKARRELGEQAIYPVPYSVAAPFGFLECDGAAISRNDYADYFALVGVTFGAGDGATTFNVPDTRSRAMLGAAAAGALALAANEGLAVGARAQTHSHGPGTFNVAGVTSAAPSQAVGILSLLSTAAPAGHTHTFAAAVAGASAVQTNTPYLGVRYVVRVIR